MRTIQVIQRSLIIATVYVSASLAQAQSVASGEPQKTVLPVRTRVIEGDGKSSCNQYSVQVNGVTYSCTDDPLTGFNIVAFNRTPDPVTRKLVLFKSAAIRTDLGHGLRPVKEYLKSLLEDSPDLLVIVSAWGQVGGPMWEIAPELEAFGATTEFRGIGYPEFAFSFVGIKGSKPGQAYQVGGDGYQKSPLDSWSLNGYFATDSQGKYAFFEPDFVQFELTPGTGLIRVDSKDYPAPGSTGLHVLAVRRENPDLVLSDNVYSLANLPDLTSTDEHTLYFITSVGSTFSKPAPKSQQLAAAMMERLGGTYDLLADAGPSDTYSLVGAIRPGGNLAPYSSAEAGSLLPSEPTELRGVLGRQRRGNFFSPVTSAFSRGINLDFFSILSQEPKAFPHPAPGNADELAAFEYIGQEVLCRKPCNPRDGYSSTSISIPTWLSNLEAASIDRRDEKNPGPNCDLPPFPQTPYCIVRTQLLTELSDVGHIREFSDNISDLWSLQHINNLYQLLAVAQQIKSDLRPNPNDVASGIVASVLHAFLTAGSSITLPTAPAFGIFDAVFSLTEDLSNNEAGDSEIFDVSTTVAELQNQAVASFNAQLVATGTMFRFIYEDWGKINALGSALTSTDPNWAWPDGTTGVILERVKPVAEAGYYRSILPTIYAVGQIHNLQSSVVTTYRSSYKTYNYPSGSYCTGYQPMPNFAPVEYLSSLEIGQSNRWYVQPLSRRDAKQGGCGNNSTDSVRYPSLSTATLTHLFDDLKVYKPDFYRNWEFPHAVCDSRGSDPNSSSSSGCNWRGAQFQSWEWTAAVVAPAATQSPQIDVQAVTSLSGRQPPLSYSWQVLEGQATILNGDTAAPTVQFTSGPGTYVIRVTVTDSEGVSATGEMPVVYRD